MFNSMDQYKEKDVAQVKICCSVELKGAVQRYGLKAELSAVQLSAEGWLFFLSLPDPYTAKLGP